MRRQVGWIRKTLPTKVTIKWPFARMSSQMTLEAARVVEPFFTYVAPVRLLSRVDAQMRLQVGVLNEPLLADFAFKRPFPCVRTHMSIEGEQPIEFLCADVALENLLSVYPIQRVK